MQFLLGLVVAILTAVVIDRRSPFLLIVIVVVYLIAYYVWQYNGWLPTVW